DFGPGRVEATLRAPPATLFVARTMLSFAFPLPPEPLRDILADPLADAVVRALVSERARHIFSHFTQGAVRYRIDWAPGGQRPATVWRIAEGVAAAAPDLVNDPRGATWEAGVHENVSGPKRGLV